MPSPSVCPHPTAHPCEPCLAQPPCVGGLGQQARALHLGQASVRKWHQGARQSGRVLAGAWQGHGLQRLSATAGHTGLGQESGCAKCRGKSQPSMCQGFPLPTPVTPGCTTAQEAAPSQGLACALSSIAPR
ncbi:hypothetical protein KIL84_016171 [Mauremys mutica]|uniref:Uncharacterized protein n=1 Tax=Mauremys mutica TaxID=74926 RepID=A0A9D3WS63_9SAUR|nr:hypothetical protein KIL84_016171 [Mauremys mutica]